MNKSNLRILLFSEQKGKCHYCHCDLIAEIKKRHKPHLDRTIPKIRGGRYELGNVRLVCGPCDSSKSDRSEEEFVEYIKPYVNGQVKDRKDLSEYNQYLKLKKKYGQS